MLSSLQNHRRWSIALGLGLLLLGLIALLAVALAVRSTYHSIPPATGRPAQASVDSIAGWMTVRYIARTYQVPEPILLQALGIDAPQARFHTIAGIARMQRIPADAEIEKVRAAILAYRAGGGATPPPADRVQ